MWIANCATIICVSISICATTATATTTAAIADCAPATYGSPWYFIRIGFYTRKRKRKILNFFQWVSNRMVWINDWNLAKYLVSSFFVLFCFVYFKWKSKRKVRFQRYVFFSPIVFATQGNRKFFPSNKLSDKKQEAITC